MPIPHATTCRKEGALDMGDAGMANSLGEAARAAGVRHPVLQGRAYGPYKDRVAHPIYNTDREIYALGPAWREAFRHKDAVLMVPAA